MFKYLKAGEELRSEEEGVELVRRGGREGRSRPRATDSGTVRRVVVSTRAVDGWAVGLEDDEGWLFFGRPRAAAPRERRVVRLARRAASWSGWWFGERALYGE